MTYNAFPVSVLARDASSNVVAAAAAAATIPHQFPKMTFANPPLPLNNPPPQLAHNHYPRIQQSQHPYHPPPQQYHHQPLHHSQPHPQSQPQLPLHHQPPSQPPSQPRPPPPPSHQQLHHLQQQSHQQHQHQQHQHQHQQPSYNRQSSHYYQPSFSSHRSLTHSLPSNPLGSAIRHSRHDSTAPSIPNLAMPFPSTHPHPHHQSHVPSLPQPQQQQQSIFSSASSLVFPSTCSTTQNSKVEIRVFPPHSQQTQKHQTHPAVKRPYDHPLLPQSVPQSPYPTPSEPEFIAGMTRDAFVKICTTYLESSVTLNPISADKSVSLPDHKQPESVFFSIQEPDISTSEYLRRLVCYTQCSPSAFVVMLIYLDRAACANPLLRLCAFNLHRLLVTALMLACKILDDHCFATAHYAKVGGIPTPLEMNRLELQFLRVLDFRTHVTLGQFLVKQQELSILAIAL